MNGKFHESPVIYICLTAPPLISTKCGDSIQDSLSQSVSAPDLLLNSTKQSAAILFKKKNLSKMDECGIRPMSIQAEVEPNMRFGAHDGVPPGATNKFLDLTSSASYDSRLGITPHQGWSPLNPDWPPSRPGLQASGSGRRRWRRRGSSTRECPTR